MKASSITAKIRDFVLGRIERGQWKEGEKIPSEAELMDRFSASRMTVHRAVKELAAEGVIYRRRGSGSFVAKRLPRSELLRVGDIAEEIRSRGGAHSCEVRFLGRDSRGPLGESVFGKEASRRLVRSKVVHFEDGVPLLFEDRLVDTAYAPDYQELDLTATTAHAYLMEVAPLAEAEHQLTAALPTSDQQECLCISPNEPCLVLERRTWSRKGLVSFAQLVYPGSRYSFGGVFSPAAGES